MPINFSRRSFLSTGAKTAAAVAIYSSIETKGATVLVNSVVPSEASTQAAAMQPWLRQLDQYIARHMRETGAPV